MRITRFAPSPTGYLHVGNLRTALIAWLCAKKSGGKFILRIDDTDQDRSKKEYENSIIEDLKWCSVEWADLKRQSDRLSRYEEAKQKLISDGRLYKCFETPEELELRRKVLISRSKPPIYGREALSLTEDEIAKLEESGKRPHWRFKLDHDSEIRWRDGVRREMHFKPSNLSDPILIREDGTLTYSLASVVDDIDFGITDIIRGEDHISNSAIHIQLFEALGAKAPGFSHISLLKTKESGISKRDGGFAVRDLREKGVFALPLVSYLITLGSSDDIVLKNSLEDVVSGFDIEKFSKAICNYNEADLLRLNTQYIHSMPYDEASLHLKNIGIKIGVDVNEAFWLSVRDNISCLEDVRDWVIVCSDRVSPIIEDADYCSQIAELLPENLDESSWDIWITSIKKQTGRNGAKLFLPIRLALTGRKDGPELQKMLKLIGKERIINRLISGHATKESFADRLKKKKADSKEEKIT